MGSCKSPASFLWGPSRIGEQKRCTSRKAPILGAFRGFRGQKTARFFRRCIWLILPICTDSNPCSIFFEPCFPLFSRNFNTQPIKRTGRKSVCFFVDKQQSRKNELANKPVLEPNAIYYVQICSRNCFAEDDA